ncbi:TPA: hypothetical protein DHW51_22170, partial [Candidatus Poribacteria bacterium]|nr:hypothetical protein [Candidatus Poribacteria bacterium]
MALKRCQIKKGLEQAVKSVLLVADVDYKKNHFQIRNRYTWLHHGLRPTKSTENVQKHHRSNELGLFVTQPT